VNRVTRAFTWSLAATLVVGAAAFAGSRTGVEAVPTPATCSTAFRIEQTFASGSRWTMCFEIRNDEGLVIRNARYTTPAGAEIAVLGQANLGQLHVPYDDNGARFHDLSDYGMGANLTTLIPSECPSGNLVPVAGFGNICKQHVRRGYAYKYYDQQAQGHSLVVSAVSAIGAYNYIVRFHFMDDGAIRPEIGATGQLQRIGGAPQDGWDLGGGRIGIAHLHNYYWRLDFDLNGAGGDSVEQLQAVPSVDKQSYANERRVFTTETRASVSARNFRSWRIRDNGTNADGHRMSYEILPESSHVFRGPSYEPFSTHDFAVLVNRSCERFASHNSTLGGCASNLSAFANSESLSGASDIVVWYGTSFHHLPRDEDEEHMHSHWTSFTIVPRDLTAVNPLP
jgi:primary-amine oxidase